MWFVSYKYNKAFWQNLLMHEVSNEGWVILYNRNLVNPENIT